MRKKIFPALLLFVLAALPGCIGGTQTCRVTGLSPGSLYRYDYEDSDGNAVVGEFRPEGTTYDIPGVDSSIDCASVDVSRATIDLIAEGPVV